MITGQLIACAEGDPAAHRTGGIIRELFPPLFLHPFRVASRYVAQLNLLYRNQSNRMEQYMPIGGPHTPRLTAGRRLMSAREYKHRRGNPSEMTLWRDEKRGSAETYPHQRSQILVRRRGFRLSRPTRSAAGGAP
jgi:hypothetical protein